MERLNNPTPYGESCDGTTSGRHTLEYEGFDIFWCDSCGKTFKAIWNEDQIELKPLGEIDLDEDTFASEPRTKIRKMDVPVEYYSLMDFIKKKINKILS